MNVVVEILATLAVVIAVTLFVVIYQVYVAQAQRDLYATRRARDVWEFKRDTRQLAADLRRELDDELRGW